MDEPKKKKDGCGLALIVVVVIYVLINLLLTWLDKTVPGGTEGFGLILYIVLGIVLVIIGISHVS